MKLVVLSGPMAGGKSTELLRRLAVEDTAGQNVLYVNSSVDTRNEKGIFSTHNPLYRETLEDIGITFASVSDIRSILQDEYIHKYSVIGIDEAQFYTEGLYETVLSLVEDHKKDVFVCGLLTDSNRKLFGEVHRLLSMCDEHIALTGVCMSCIVRSPPVRSSSVFTYKRNEVECEGGSVDVGGLEKYIPVCRSCYLALQQGEMK